MRSFIRESLQHQEYGKRALPVVISQGRQLVLMFGFMDSLASPFAGVSSAVEIAGAVELGLVGGLIMAGAANRVVLHRISLEGWSM